MSVITASNFTHLAYIYIRPISRMFVWNGMTEVYTLNEWLFSLSLLHIYPQQWYILYFMHFTTCLDFFYLCIISNLISIKMVVDENISK